MVVNVADTTEYTRDDVNQQPTDANNILLPKNSLHFDADNTLLPANFRQSGID